MNSCYRTESKLGQKNRQIGRSGAHLKPLTHLQVILIRKVPSQALDFDSVPRRILYEFESDCLQPVLDESSDFTRVWARHLVQRVCLSDDEQILDLPDVIFGLAFDRDTAQARLMCQLTCCLESATRLHTGTQGTRTEVACA